MKQHDDTVFSDHLSSARDKWAWRGQQRPSWAFAPGSDQESVWDYPRPPLIETSDRHVQVCVGATIVADSTRTKRVLETASPPSFYIPTADINMSLLRPIHGSSICEWKGWARYWTLSTGDGEVVGWDYPEPFEGMEGIVDHLSFYPSKLDCRVDGESVTPQPGKYYGGWVTQDLVGPYKGEPGSEGW